MPSLVQTTTPLTANDTFTSAAQQLSRAVALTGTVFADQNGQLIIEQSGDGQNWDINITANVTANVGEAIDIEVIGQFFRVRYVNGTAAQTVFRLFVDPRDPYGAFLTSPSDPSPGGAYAVLYWDTNRGTYVYLGRYDGADAYGANSAAAVASNQSGKYAAFAVTDALVTDETIFRTTEYAPDTF
jgi:hypothetical protein